MPVMRSMALKTASTGPSPMLASRWMVPSWCHRQTAAEWIVPEPALQVNASSVHEVGAELICVSASASMSAS